MTRPLGTNVTDDTATNLCRAEYENQHDYPVGIDISTLPLGLIPTVDRRQLDTR